MSNQGGMSKGTFAIFFTKEELFALTKFLESMNEKNDLNEFIESAQKKLAKCRNSLLDPLKKSFEEHKND